MSRTIKRSEEKSEENGDPNDEKQRQLPQEFDVDLLGADVEMIDVVKVEEE